MKFLLLVSVMLFAVWGVIWLISGGKGLTPAWFVIVGVPWLFYAGSMMVKGRPTWCDTENPESPTYSIAVCGKPKAKKP